MNFEAIKSGVASKFARQILVTQKHSPKILFVAGSIGVVGTVVLACRATLKMTDVLDNHEDETKILAVRLGGKFQNDDSQITQDEHDALARKLQIKTAVDITKLYAPAVGVGIVSIAALTGSHVILTKRNGAVMAAYAGLDRAYKRYRQNVIDVHGKEDDQKFASGARNVHVEEQLANGKTKITVKTEMDKGGKYSGSPYAALFDEKSQWWTPMPGGNSDIIFMRQSWANDKLKSKGHLFLNEVYDFLDLPRTKAGAVVGWVYDPKNENHTGDNYVSFGVFDNDEDTAERFILGQEKSIWLDFNVDGVIYNLL
jgi:uncharacterized protein DUF6353